jgi:ribonuclease E
LLHSEPVEQRRSGDGEEKSARRKGKRGKATDHEATESALNEEQRKAAANAMAVIAKVAAHDEDEAAASADANAAGAALAEPVAQAAESSAAVSEPAAVEPSSELSSELSSEPSSEPSGGDEPAAPAPRRRRRAASRPAGPPVAAESVH